MNRNIVLLVLFIIAMAVWALGNLGTFPTPNTSPWVPFAAVLILGLVVYWPGSGPRAPGT